VTTLRPYVPPWQRKPQGEGTGGKLRVTWYWKQLVTDRDITNAMGGAIGGSYVQLWLPPPVPKGMGSLC
jgi:hypothetical protein